MTGQEPSFTGNNILSWFDVQTHYRKFQVISNLQFFRGGREF